MDVFSSSQQLQHQFPELLKMQLNNIDASVGKHEMSWRKIHNKGSDHFFSRGNYRGVVCCLIYQPVDKTDCTGCSSGKAVGWMLPCVALASCLTLMLSKVLALTFQWPRKNLIATTVSYRSCFYSLNCERKGSNQQTINQWTCDYKRWLKRQKQPPWDDLHNLISLLYLPLSPLSLPKLGSKDTKALRSSFWCNHIIGFWCVFEPEIRIKVHSSQRSIAQISVLIYSILIKFKSTDSSNITAAWVNPIMLLKGILWISDSRCSFATSNQVWVSDGKKKWKCMCAHSVLCLFTQVESSFITSAVFPAISYFSPGVLFCNILNVSHASQRSLSNAALWSSGASICSGKGLYSLRLSYKCVF